MERGGGGRGGAREEQRRLCVGRIDRRWLVYDGVDVHAFHFFTSGLCSRGVGRGVGEEFKIRRTVVRI